MSAGMKTVVVLFIAALLFATLPISGASAQGPYSWYNNWNRGYNNNWNYNYNWNNLSGLGSNNAWNRAYNYGWNYNWNYGSGLNNYNYNYNWQNAYRPNYQYGWGGRR